MPDLEELLRRLVTHEVRFVVIGGYAAVVHGSTMVTQDLDVCCDFSVPNLLRVAKALAGLDPAHRMVPHRPRLDMTPEFCRGLRNLYLVTSLGQIDCLSDVHGVGTFDEVWAGSEEIALPWGRFRVLGLDTLIRSKQELGRPKDRESVLQLESIRERLRDDAR